MHYCVALNNLFFFLLIQNFTQDNWTQGIMEKSQWDLKKIRFQRRRLTWLDNLVLIYQRMHDAQLCEYEDRKIKKENKEFFQFTNIVNVMFHNYKPKVLD